MNKTHSRRLRSFISDRKSTRLNSSHEWISYAVFCLKKKTWLCIVEDTLNLCPLGSVRNPDWKTLKSLTICLGSTCAHSARHRYDISRKAAYRLGIVD